MNIYISPLLPPSLFFISSFFLLCSSLPPYLSILPFLSSSTHLPFYSLSVWLFITHIATYLTVNTITCCYCNFFPVIQATSTWRGRGHVSVDASERCNGGQLHVYVNIPLTKNNFHSLETPMQYNG